MKLAETAGIPVELLNRFEMKLKISEITVVNNYSRIQINGDI